MVGSVAVVGEKVLQNIATPTFVDALQGQVAGLNIYSGSGDPNSIASTSIRGVNSINAGTTPLYILDGAPISSSMFTTLNPNDIQNITVLKDAASVAIYGSRAANGVIVITSKKGSNETKPSVAVSAKYGWSQMVEDNVTMMNSQQYIEFRDKINQPVKDDVRDLVKKYGISTNWRDVIFDSHAPTYSVDATVSGGGEVANYYLSLNHYDQDGIITSSGMSRETLRSSLNIKVNDWLRVGMQSNLGFTKYDTNSAVTDSKLYIDNPMIAARRALPYDDPYYYTIDEKGNLIRGEKALYYHYSGYTTPDYSTQIAVRDRNKLTLNANIYQQITPIDGLILRAQQSIDAAELRIGGYKKPFYSYETPMGDLIGDPDPDTGQRVGVLQKGWNTQSFNRYYQFTSTNTAEYRFSLADQHNFTFLAGEETIYSNENGFGVSTSGQTDIRQTLLTQGTDIVIADDVSQVLNTVSFNSWFLKADYDFDNKYYLQGSYRRDGSSKFADGHRWSSFWSVGAMWNAKKESFLENVEWLNEAQARISYGTTGNSSIPNYQYIGTVGSYDGMYGPTKTPGNGIVSGIGLATPANPDLSWETVYSFDTGLHAKLIDMISVDFDYYYKATKDMLMYIPWSITTGFPGGYGNIGSMENKGFELTVNADLVKTRDFSWTFRANTNYNKNVITELFNNRQYYSEGATSTRLELGHANGEFYLVRYAGVDPADGKQMWYDKNGNLTKQYNVATDAVMMNKSPYAPWTGGFGSSLRWKDLTLSFDVNWVEGKYMMNNDAYFVNNAKFGPSQNLSSSMMDVWTKPGDITMHPGANQEIQFDSRLLENASFMRLKNVTLAYMLPREISKEMGLSSMKFHFTGRNLWTLTNFSGYDPEPLTNMYKFAYPNTRQYEFGVELSF